MTASLFPSQRNDHKLIPRDFLGSIFLSGCKEREVSSARKKRVLWMSESSKEYIKSSSSSCETTCYTEIRDAFNSYGSDRLDFTPFSNFVSFFFILFCDSKSYSRNWYLIPNIKINWHFSCECVCVCTELISVGFYELYNFKSIFLYAFVWLLKLMGSIIIGYVSQHYWLFFLVYIQCEQNVTWHFDVRILIFFLLFYSSRHEAWFL